MKEYIVLLDEEEAFYGYKDNARELIRCKDCKHYDKFISQNIGQGWCDVAAWRGRYMRNDDFCSRAEPKEK